MHSKCQIIDNETQSNLTVASLLGGLCWVIYFSSNIFLTDSKTADPKNILEKNKCYSSVPNRKSVTYLRTNTQKY